MFSRHAVSQESEVINCPECYGKGEVRVDCARCNGCGKETCHECGGKNISPDPAWSTPWRSCVRCDGTGREKCGACHGSGYKWGACHTCDGERVVTAETLADVREQKQIAQQQKEAEDWQYLEEEARRWDAEVGQWFEQDLSRRIERRRLQRHEQRQRRWKTWKRRMATASCLTVIALVSLRYGPSGVLWARTEALRARTEAQRYLPPSLMSPSQDRPAPPFMPSQRRLTRVELQHHSRRRLELLRHELLARRGLKMTRRDLAQHFADKPWYRPDTSNPRVVWDRLSPIEQYNLWLLTDLLTQQGPRTH